MNRKKVLKLLIIPIIVFLTAFIGNHQIFAQVNTLGNQVISSNIQVNSYCRITGISNDGNTIQLSSQDQYLGQYGNFNIGDFIMLHVSGGTDTNWVGNYGFFTVKNIDSTNITLSESCLNIINNTALAEKVVQIVKIPVFDDLVIEQGVKLSPIAYNGKYGGIIAIKALNSCTLRGTIDASFTGYTKSFSAPNNSGAGTSGNPTISGGSNQFKGGNGGVNYQKSIGYAPSSIGIPNLKDGKMYFGGGSNSSRGGGILYLSTPKLSIYKEYSLSSNGQGGNGPNDGGAAGGSIYLNVKDLIFSSDAIKNFFAGATGGGGGGEWCKNVSAVDFPYIIGENGTNLKGGNGASYTGKGGNGVGANGGGGSTHNNNGVSATASNGGNGATSSQLAGGYGWNAGAGGGGGGYIAIYTDKNISSIGMYPSPFLDKYKSDIALPAAPILSANLENSKVKLSWKLVEGATNYNIYRSQKPQGPYTDFIPPKTVTEGVYYIDTEVTNGTTYYYVVTSENKSGKSAYSNEVTVTPKSQEITLDIHAIEKTKVGDEIIATVEIHNATNICAEDIRIAYDTKRLEYIGSESADGIKLFKESDLGNGTNHYITASLGKINAANGDKILLKLKFKAKAIGEAKVDIIKGRIADNSTLEMDVADKNCGEKTIIIEATKDVNRTGEFTLLDLGIDAWYYGDAASSTDSSKYDADVVIDGKIDDADLQEIVKEMLKNPNYIN